jgi:type I restriction enzyme, R subunit
MDAPSANNSEWLTRKRLIDPKIRAAGWRIVPFSPSKSLAEYNGCAIEEFETTCGPADRVCDRSECPISAERKIG